MAETTKNHSLIINIIKPPQPPARFSTESLCDGDALKPPSPPPPQQHRVPFFRPFSQRRGANTWVISFFVVVHLILFTSTMLVNNCGLYSHGDCALRPLGRFSFQHLSENPLLGPSASTLDEMGALRERYITKKHEYWRIFTCPWLHSGFGHLIINLSSVIFIGTHLEQDFGPLRIGVIYLISAFTGSTLAVLFLQDRPSVASSCVLFGLLGAMLSALIRNWKFYTKKSAASITIFIIFSINLLLGLLPYINNFANIGGLLSGFLLGFVLLFSPEMGQNVLIKGGLYEYKAKFSDQLRQKLDRPVLRSISLVIFSLLLAGVIVAVLRGINVGKSCSWCHYIDCLPCKWWSCSDKATHCECGGIYIFIGKKKQHNRRNKTPKPLMFNHKEEILFSGGTKLTFIFCCQVLSSTSVLLEKARDDFDKMVPTFHKQQLWKSFTGKCPHLQPSPIL